MARCCKVESLTLMLVSSLALLWLPSCFGDTAYATAQRRRSVLFQSRVAIQRRRQEHTTMACLHHAGGAALMGPLGGNRSWTRSGGGPPALWALITTGVAVAASSAKVVVLRLANEGGHEGEDARSDATEAGGAEEGIKSVMISFIKAYKKELSPIIPPACRFLPTCSVYGVEAIEKFGATKGAILTAWRLMRCNPFAGYGVDHPRWPPPGWFAGEKW